MDYEVERYFVKRAFNKKEECATDISVPLS